MGREGTECILEREEKEKKSYVLTDRRCPNLTITIRTLAVWHHLLGKKDFAKRSFLLQK